MTFAVQQIVALKSILYKFYPNIAFICSANTFCWVNPNWTFHCNKIKVKIAKNKKKLLMMFHHLFELTKYFCHAYTSQLLSLKWTNISILTFHFNIRPLTT